MCPGKNMKAGKHDAVNAAEEKGN
jgi:hypothetical protein